MTILIQNNDHNITILLIMMIIIIIMITKCYKTSYKYNKLLLDDMNSKTNPRMVEFWELEISWRSLASWFQNKQENLTKLRIFTLNYFPPDSMANISESKILNLHFSILFETSNKFHGCNLLSLSQKLPGYSNPSSNVTIYNLLFLKFE